MALFNILIDIAARTASFESGIQRVEKGIGQLNATATRFARNAQGLLGVAVGFEAVRRSIGAAVARGDQLDRLSDRLKTSATFLSQLQFAATQSDVPFERLSSSLDTMRKNVSLAADGLGKARPALKALGIDAKAFSDLALDEQFETLADGIASIENPTHQSRYAVQIFGDSANDLIPILKQGSQGIREFRAESDRLGHTINDQAAKQLAAADKAIKDMKASATGLTNQLAVGLGPAITSVADSLRKLAGGATELEILESKLAFLQEESSSFLPFILNFGYVDGGGVVMGPKALEQEIKRIEERIASLRRTASGDSLSEIVVSVQRMEEPSFKRFINPQTMLEFERNVEYITEIEQNLIAETKRNTEQFAAFYKDGVARGIQATAESVEADLLKMVEDTQSATADMSVFADEAARNMQSAFADFLFDPFEDGAKGMLRGFVDVLRRMLAEAAAAQIFEKLFGSDKGGSGLSGWLSLLFGGSGKKSSGGDALSTMFGLMGVAGARAGGGDVRSGSTYLVGERGPELFTAGRSGMITPNHKLGGSGGPISISQHISGVGLSQEQLAVVLQRNNREMIEQIRQAMSRSGQPVPVF